ncbi:armadillo-type protein [Ochromonadaceae sp. CCMP2298]|nr:armadillo-type protein [Ochromonadaceae sp. CCMP2298]
MLRFAFGKVGGNIRRAFPTSHTMVRGGGIKLGMKRMLCSVSPQGSRRAAVANHLMNVALGLLLLGLYGSWAYPIEIDVVQLRHGTSGMKTRAARHLLLTGGWQEAGWQVKFAEAGGIELLFALLRDGTPEGKAWAAISIFALSRIAIADKQEEVKIADAGVIEALVAALRLDGTSAAFAAQMLGYAARRNADDRVKIAEEGGIEALTALLRDGTLVGKAFAAIGLLTFSVEQVADAGVIESLIALLRDGTPYVKPIAADGLAMAAVNVHNRVKIEEAGGIEMLFALLRDETPDGKEMAENGKAMAKTALLVLSLDTIPLPYKVGTQSNYLQIMELLQNGTPKGKALAARVSNLHMQGMLLDAGVIEALVALLRDGTLQGKEYAADQLMKAANYAGNRDKIAEAGGVEALAALLSHGTLEAKLYAAIALLRVVSVSADSRVKIAGAGVIEAFIAVLRDGTPEGKELAAYGLHHAAINADNRVKIAKAGGIELLKVLLRDGTPKGKEAAAGALEILTKKTA